MLAPEERLKVSKTNWLKEVSKRAGILERTVYNWWAAFCHETGCPRTPRHADASDREQFFAWLHAGPAHQEARTAPRRGAREAQRQQLALDALYGQLAAAATAYGRDTVIEEVLQRFVAHGGSQYRLLRISRAQQAG